MEADAWDTSRYWAIQQTVWSQCPGQGSVVASRIAEAIKSGGEQHITTVSDYKGVFFVVCHHGITYVCIGALNRKP